MKDHNQFDSIHLRNTSSVYIWKEFCHHNWMKFFLDLKFLQRGNFFRDVLYWLRIEKIFFQLILMNKQSKWHHIFLKGPLNRSVNTIDSSDLNLVKHLKNFLVSLNDLHLFRDFLNWLLKKWKCEKLHEQWSSFNCNLWNNFLERNPFCSY